MRTVLFQNSERKISEAAIERCSPEMLSNRILDFDNKLMEGTKNFCKLLEDTSKGDRFYKTADLQPIYLLKRALLLRKILMIMLGVFRTKPHIYDGAFLQKYTVRNLFQSALSQMFDWVLNIPLSSERFIREYEYMTNSSSLII